MSECPASRAGASALCTESASGTTRAHGCYLVMIASTATRAPAPSDRVYVFVSDDDSACAFSTQPDGGNIPTPSTGGHWVSRDVVSMTRESIERYVFDPDIAIANLDTRGYHLSRMCAETSLFRVIAERPS